MPVGLYTPYQTVMRQVGAKHPRQNLENPLKFIYADASPIANFTKLGTIPMNSKKFFTQLPAVFILTLGSLILSPTIANSQPQEAIDRWADNFFYSVNPQLSRRKLRADETLYIREWNAIARAVPDILVYQNNSCGGGGYKPTFEWMLSNYDTQSRNGLNLVSEDLDKIADAIFYVRNPELGGRKIQPGETALANEWLRIRTAVSRLHPCD